MKHFWWKGLVLAAVFFGSVACQHGPAPAPNGSAYPTLESSLQRRFPAGATLANLAAYLYDQGYDLRTWKPDVVTYAKKEREYLDQTATYYVYAYHTNGIIQNITTERVVK